MKASVLFVAGLLCLMGANAQEKKKAKVNKRVPIATVYLHNDSIAEGYLMNPTMHARLYVSPLFSTTDDFVKISVIGSRLLARQPKYDVGEVDSVVTYYAADPEASRMTWIPIVANIAYKTSMPSVCSHKVFAACIYRGRHITAYAVSDAVLGDRVLYKSNSMAMAQAIFNLRKSLSDKQRKTLKAEFADYPGLVSFVDTMDKNLVRTNPKALFDKMDEVIR